MASGQQPFTPKKPSTEELIDGHLYNAEKAIKDALVAFARETGLAITEINITNLMKYNAFGQELTDISITTKINLIKRM